MSSRAYGYIGKFKQKENESEQFAHVVHFMAVKVLITTAPAELKKLAVTV